MDASVHGQPAAGRADNSRIEPVFLCSGRQTRA